MSSPQPAFENPAPGQHLVDNQHPPADQHTPPGKRTLANQANAQHSTGPRTAAGKHKVSRNALAHGLSASNDSLFAHSPELQAAFNAHCDKLRAANRPLSQAEEALFNRWAFSSFQAQRAQQYEALAEADMLADFGNPNLEVRYLRFSRHRVRLAREADAAFHAFFALHQFLLECAEIAAQQKAILSAAAAIPPSPPPSFPKFSPRQNKPNPPRSHPNPASAAPPPGARP
ncbi:MAG: hypothetical protein NW208_17080 [Bryobacter sp.]|nr:hypothetical protein [Bryobacter sp.]